MRPTRRWLAAMRARRIRVGPPQTQTERTTRWVVSARARLLAAYGGFCWGCGANHGTDLELAHRLPTGLDGRSRGSAARLRDAQAHPFAYLPLCRRCHRDFGGPESWGPFPGPDRPDPEIPWDGPTVPGDVDEDETGERGPYQTAIHEAEA